MIISGPGWFGIVIIVLGAMIWIAELVGKARRRSATSAAKVQLKADLTAPPPSANLPYGLSVPPAGETDAPN
jgi:hypothetical protein